MDELWAGPAGPGDQIGENAGELWDIYDLDRNRTGRTQRRGDPWPEGCYRLSVHVCVFDSRGRMLLQLRQPWKRGWPGKWDLTVGGSAQAGDDSRAAAVREAREELGLDLDLTGCRPAMTLQFSQGFDDIWLVHQDVDLSTLRLQTAEVQAVRWTSREEALALVEAGEMIPYLHLGLLYDLAERPEGVEIWRR